MSWLSRHWRWNRSSLYQILEWRNEPEFWLIVRLYIVASLICPGIKIGQIKYKYGAFRFYLELPLWLLNSKLNFINRLTQLHARYAKAESVTSDMIRNYEG